MKKILVLVSAVVLSVSLSAQQNWNSEYEGENGAVIVRQSEKQTVSVGAQTSGTGNTGKAANVATPSGSSASAAVATRQSWDNEYAGNGTPTIHKAIKDNEATLPTEEIKDPTPVPTPDPNAGTSPVGALALPFAAMLGLYGVASLKKKEE